MRNLIALYGRSNTSCAALNGCAISRLEIRDVHPALAHAVLHLVEGNLMKQPKLTQCPCATYSEYKPNPAMRLAMERAAKDQPSLIAMASKIDPNYSAVRDRGTR